VCALGLPIFQLHRFGLRFTMPCSTFKHPDFEKKTCASACFLTYEEEIKKRIDIARADKRAQYQKRGEDAVSSDAAAEDARVPEQPELDEAEDNEPED
jgi:hypothetical protein